jgi:MFS family permease
VGYGADGAQNVVGMVIWPIFIYQLLNHQYFAVGAISSAIILATVILNLIMGNITDKISKRHLMKVGTALFAIGWLMKAFIQTGFQIFVISSYHSFAGVVRGIPFSTFIYEEMADQGHYIDEYTVFRDISLNTGRALMLITCFILIGFVGLNWTFVLAAIVSLFVSVL